MILKGWFSWGSAFASSYRTEQFPSTLFYVALSCEVLPRETGNRVMIYFDNYPALRIQKPHFDEVSHLICSRFRKFNSSPPSPHLSRQIFQMWVFSANWSFIYIKKLIMQASMIKVCDKTPLASAVKGFCQV